MQKVFFLNKQQILSYKHAILYVVMDMNIKRHIGIILVIVGLLLTMDRTVEFQGIVATLAYYIQEFWPMVLLFIGIYLLSNPKKTKK